MGRNRKIKTQRQALRKVFEKPANQKLINESNKLILGSRAVLKKVRIFRIAFIVMTMIPITEALYIYILWEKTN